LKTDIRLLGQNPPATTSSGPEPNTQREPVDDRPRSVYEIVTRQMLEELKADVGEVKGRVNTLLWLVAGAVLLEFVVRLVK
jgi:hypothetical protein